VHQILIISVRY